MKLRIFGILLAVSALLWVGWSAFNAFTVALESRALAVDNILNPSN